MAKNVPISYKNILILLGELISHDDITSRNSRFYHWTSHYFVGN